MQKVIYSCLKAPQNLSCDRFEGVRNTGEDSCTRLCIRKLNPSLNAAYGL